MEPVVAGAAPAAVGKIEDSQEFKDALAKSREEHRLNLEAEYQRKQREWEAAHPKPAAPAGNGADYFEAWGERLWARPWTWGLASLLVLLALAVFGLTYVWFQVAAVLMLALIAWLFYRALVPKRGSGRFWSRTVPGWIEAVSLAVIARNVARPTRRVKVKPLDMGQSQSSQLGKDEPWPGKLL